MPRRPKPKPIPLQLFPFTSWEEELAAIQTYEGWLNTDPLQRDVLHACLYEYARHLWQEKGTLEEQALLLDRHPWDAFAEYDGFPSRPYLAIPPEQKKYIQSNIDPERTGGAFQLPGPIHLYAGTLKNMEEAIEKDIQAAMQNGKAPLSLPRVTAGNPFQEHVLFTLDYRKGRTILVADFEDWLDTHGAEMLKHAITHQGGGLGLFSDRLQDLIRWRVANQLGRKEGKAFSFGKNATTRLQEFDRAEERAKEFIRFLNLVSFSNLYQLVLDHRLWQEEQKRLAEQNAHLKPSG